MRELKEDFPCLICGEVLYREMDDQGQPRDGVICTTHGNYGSRAFDDLHGEYLAFNICDDCLRDRARAGRIFITQGSIPVWVEGSICGAYPVDRPYVEWKPEMEPSSERFNLELTEIIEGNYPDTIRWNDGGRGDWPDMLVGGFLNENPELEAEVRELLPNHGERIDAIMAKIDRYMKQRNKGSN